MTVNAKTVLLALGAVMVFIGLIAGVAWASGPGIEDLRRGQELSEQRHDMQMRQECEASGGEYIYRKRQGYSIENYKCEWKGR